MSVAEKQEEIIQECRSFDGCLDKYNYLIKLGKALPPMKADLQTEENLIEGCQAKAWFYSELVEGKVVYHIDSDSLVIRGIIALLLRVLSGQKPTDIKEADLKFIDELGLNEDFLPSHPSNLQKIVERMKEAARQYE